MKSTLIQSTLIHVNRRVTLAAMTLYIGAGEAARRLGVRRETLYAYVSRGVIRRRASVDGRTSLYAVDDIEMLANRSRQRTPAPRPSIDVQITSAITQLDEQALSYRGVEVAALSRDCSFEQVAELLWDGTLPSSAVRWPGPDRADVDACAAAVHGLGSSAGALVALTAVIPVLAARHPEDRPQAAARRFISIVPALSEASVDGSIAERLARAWHPDPTPDLVRAIDRALVLLADHELATSTLAVRIATSVRTDAYAAFGAGMATLTGVLHGSSAAGAAALLADAAERGPVVATRGVLDTGRRLSGFGHSVYRTGDPRLEPLLEAVRALPDPSGRYEIVDAVMREASGQIVARPNVDFGLAALSFVGGLDADVPIFAVARVAGWAAHIEEELLERPLRFRGVARPPA
jgi:citrate synthase